MAFAQAASLPHPPEYPKLPHASCNLGVAMFASRSDVVDATAARELDRVSAMISPFMANEGVSLIVSPHPIYTEPVDAAARRALADGRGEKIRQYLAGRGLPADKIGIRLAATDPSIPDNWGEGALLLLEMPSETWDRLNLKDVC